MHVHKTLESVPVGHANEQDVIQGIHTIDFGEQLVHHGVMHASATGYAASLLADGIYLVKDDHMQVRIITLK